MTQLDKDKHCGFCSNFDYESMYGDGHCSKLDILVNCTWKGKSKSAKSCEEWVERKDKFCNTGQIT